MKKILVIGSSNIDLVARVKRFPNNGETIIGESFNTYLGGKGLNQAISAKLANADVTFLTALGNDNNKDYILNELKKYDLNVCPIIKNANTGTAIILVNEQTGENQIVVNGGANILLNKKDIDDNISLINEADYILLQLEIPLDVIEYIVDIANKQNKTIILNPAPFKELPRSILSKLTFITPNEGELYKLVNNSSLDYLTNASSLLELGIKNVIVTLGSNGSCFITNNYNEKIDAIKVNAVDTTGAGDSYNGVFVASLSLGYSIKESLKLSTIASAISVTKNGASSSYPSFEEIMKFKSKNNL